MSTTSDNICFRGEIRRILCGYTLLSVAMDCSCMFQRKKNGGMANSVDPDQTIVLDISFAYTVLSGKLVHEILGVCQWLSGSWFILRV